MSSPAGQATSYNNNRFNDQVNRFVHGPSGEVLDAFVWSNFDLGSVPVNVKLGRHTVVWGEGMFIGAHAISYGQSPVDGMKAVSSPGIETKETFLPINQLTFKAQVTDKLSLAGQYALDWKATRVPYAGTYLMGADNAPGVDRFALTPCNPALGPYSCLAMANTAVKTSGDKNWGLSARLDVDAIDSTLGAYYRQFNDTNPETGIYISEQNPSKMGWYIDRTSEVTKTGDKTYHVKYTLTNRMTSTEMATCTSYILGGEQKGVGGVPVAPSGTSAQRVLIYAPAGGSIGSIAVTGDVRDRSNATMDGKPLNSSMAYIAPGKSVTYEFDVTVSDKATADMKLDQTPCGKMTNDVKYNY